MLTRQERWELNYRIRPYLSAAPQEDLNARAKELINNFSELSRDGKITPTDKEIVPLFLEQMAHLNIEFQRRRKSILTDSQFRPEDFWHREEILKSVNKNKEAFFAIETSPHAKFKFGSASHLTDMYEHGELLLSPASDFRSISDDRARQDDEMTITTLITPYDYDLGTIDPFFRKVIPQRSWGAVEYTKPTNFYLFCLTSKFNPRFFGDFSKADACLIIQNTKEFVKRIVGNLSKDLPGWKFSFQSCKYIDPYTFITKIPNKIEETTLLKTIKYAYQREWRLVAIPPKSTRDIKKKKIFVGSLKDISTLFLLQ